MNDDAIRTKCEKLGWKPKNKTQTWSELYESKKYMLCDECNEQKGRNSDIFDMRLCSDCFKLDKYKTICKTTVLKKYKLTQNDIKDIESFEVTNPMFKKAAPMVLFKLADIENLFCDIQNIKNTTKAIEKRISKIEAAKKPRKSPKENRRQKLIQALQEKGLELRRDSKLCEKYINRGGEDIDFVVERMCQMKYLFEYNYDVFQKNMDKAHRQYEEELEAGYIPDWPVFDEAESMTLREIGGYPDIDDYPWLN